MDPVIIATVLTGVSYPAQRWQLLAQADHYGTGGPVRAVLNQLPRKAYPSLEAVITTLEAIAAARPVAPD